MARSRRGLERTNVRDSPPAAASRKIHRRHVIERNVTKKFVSTKRQTPILGCGRTHRECRPPVLHARVTSLERAIVNPFLTQGSLNAGTCITMLTEVPQLEQQAIPCASIPN